MGATFYHMVTGQTPFSGGTAQEILKAHVQASLPPIQDFTEEHSRSRLLYHRRMMAKLPEKRYQNMANVIEDIERVQSGHVKGIERIDQTDSSILQAVKGVPMSRSARAHQQPRHENLTPEAAARQRVFGRRHRRADSCRKNCFGSHLGCGADRGNYCRRSIAETARAENRPMTRVRRALTRTPSPAIPKQNGLLGFADDAFANSELKQYERILLQVKSKYPDTAESEKADKMLLDLARSNMERPSSARQKALVDAKKFEADNQKMALESWRSTRKCLQVSGSNPPVYNEAKAKVELLEKAVAGTNSPNQTNATPGKRGLRKGGGVESRA